MWLVNVHMLAWQQVLLRGGGRRLDLARIVVSSGAFGTVGLWKATFVGPFPLEQGEHLRRERRRESFRLEVNVLGLPFGRFQRILRLKRHTIRSVRGSGSRCGVRDLHQFLVNRPRGIALLLSHRANSLFGRVHCSFGFFALRLVVVNFFLKHP